MASEAPCIVNCDWLNEHLADRTIRILDVTWSSKKDGYQDYLTEHIPNAVHFDIMRDVVLTDIYPRNIPSAEDFQKQARSVGVNSDTHVVVYDRSEECGFFVGSRAYWMFKFFGHTNVSVLNGGLLKWKQSKLPVTTDVPSVPEGNFKSKLNESVRQTYDFMASNLAESDIQVLDSRKTNIYSGNSEDSKSGHYPGAINIPFAARLLDHDTGTFKSPDEIKKVFSESGVDTDKPVVTMCNSGMSSCSLFLATQLIGSKSAAVYQAGFSEWKSKSDQSNIERC